MQRHTSPPFTYVDVLTTFLPPNEPAQLYHPGAGETGGADGGAGADSRGLRQLFLAHAGGREDSSKASTKLHKAIQNGHRIIVLGAA
jgi:hypothetical protein